MTAPTANDFKAYFNRDFPYGTTLQHVMDADITRALSEAGVKINESLFADQAAYNLGYLLLAAHFLVMNLRAASQGISGQFDWLQGSKSVGSVSESLNIPQRILDNPEFAMLCKTTYGGKYLMFVLPLLAGQIFTVEGGTHA